MGSDRTARVPLELYMPSPKPVRVERLPAAGGAHTPPTILATSMISGRVEGAYPHDALALQFCAQLRGGVTNAGCPKNRTWESVQFDMGPQLFFQFTLCFHQRLDSYGNVIAGVG
jgi:hypothetical protein